MTTKKILPDLIIVVFFVLLGAIYSSPELSGKRLLQNDVLQGVASGKELANHEKKTGKSALWTNSMFSGMPAYMIRAKQPNSLSYRVGVWLHAKLMPRSTIKLLFIFLLTSYLGFVILGFDRWISALGAIGIVFASYNLINIGAGHIFKLRAQAYAFPLIASFVMTWRGKYLTGGVLAAIFASLELYSNHPQITYYMLIGAFFIGVYEFIKALNEKTLKQFLTGTLVLLLAGGIAIGGSASLLLPNYEYTKETIRGPSELKANKTSTGGLDIDYAFQWSYGKMETFTILIPNFYGGESGGELGKKSNMYETLTRRGVQGTQAEQFVQQQPLYWGDMPFTSGPAYFGAIICFLFVFSLFAAKNTLKWWLLGIVGLLLMLSWGRNLAWFNNFFFHYVPLYNKFRAVNMFYSVINVFMIWSIALALQEIFIIGEVKKKQLVKSLWYSLGVVGGITAIFALLGGGLLTFEAAGDQSYLQRLVKMTGNQGFAQDLLSALQSDRAAMMKADAFRSLVFILLSGALLWAFLTDKLKKEYVLGGIALLVLIDLWGIDKRYLNSDKFVKKSNYSVYTDPQQFDLEILEKGKNDPHYRVLNTTKSPMSDATTSLHHKSIGGYHGAKLRRYNELMDKYLTPNMIAAYGLRTPQGTLRRHNPADSNNVSVLSMLNMKFMIDQGKKVFQNTNAMGNAWFVDSYKVVKSSDEELASLKKFDPRKTAFVNPKYASAVKGLKIAPDSKARIKLTSYAPDILKYESNASSKQLAVFSEIYYNNGLGWEAYIDGKPVPHFRVNYVLRALVVPAGKHTIEFRFEPKSFAIGEQIALIASILLVLGIVAVLFLIYRDKTKAKATEETA